MLLQGCEIMKITAILPREAFHVGDWINLEGVEHNVAYKGQEFVMPNIYAIQENCVGTGSPQEVEIWPNLIPSGQYKNVDHMPIFPVRVRHDGTPRSRAIFGFATFGGDPPDLNALSNEPEPWPERVAA